MIRITAELCLIFLCNIVFSQCYFLDPEPYRKEVKLRDIFQESNKQFNCVSLKTYDLKGFEGITNWLTKDYFRAFGYGLDGEDSIGIVEDFKKLSSAFYRQQKKNVRKVRRSLKSSKTMLYVREQDFVGECDVFIEPCYLLEIDAERHMAFIVKIRYQITDRRSKITYLISK
jgi:hypothetical protein